MKRIFIIALCVLGMYNVSAFAMVQEIVLTEMYSFILLDDPRTETDDDRPNPTRFHAFIDGNNLSVGAYTDVPAYVEVVDEETGEVVAEEEFEGETEISVEQSGSYVVQIYSGNTIMTGEFVVE